jgi:hypothetical protein
VSEKPERENGYGLTDICGKREAPWADSTAGHTFKGDGDSRVDEGGEEWQTDFCER